ncbi:hypothetical protein A8C56_09925 [Niabella ginsenosidivorans]|uniref:Entericidin n=1 Tax=Niabella ginsenosidivorans TaxID=1176587 RepID=A0A1A9I2G9_9BACT|nr:hypothetical protein [Niabella ginsenosidivorans]ANH81259.1 hypothetical protein A8C56_09925 [Niabella ginsenosidivorans]
MKKLFIVLVISSVGFVACNSGSNGDANSSDSTAVAPTTPDSINAPEKAAGDTVNLDTNAATHTDTAATKADTTSKK